MTRWGVFRCFVAAALLAAPASSNAQTPASSELKTAASQCDVAADEGYAYRLEKPVQVGGGAMFVASRERRYMDALRGPAGEPVRYKRVNSLEAPDGQAILDAYEVAYDGAEKPVTIYLDAYHFDDGMRAPKGFTCGAPIALDAPGPDLFQASRYLLRLAVEQGAGRDFAPIPLDPQNADPKTHRGVALDHFRMMARVARAAAASSKPIVLDPAVRPPDSLRQRTVVVAYPISCEGRTIAPQSIDLISAQGQHAPRQGDYATGEPLTALVPGLDAPAGSVAATFGLQAPRPNEMVKITYTEACGGVTDVTLKLQHSPLRLLEAPEPTMPEGATASNGSIRLQAQIDLDGRLHHATYVGGPRDLVQAAIEALKGWTVEPVRINGAPISTPVALQVRFRPRAGADPGKDRRE